MNTPSVTVVKYSGEEVLFDSQKLKNSLLNSGASENTASHIASNIAANLKSGAKTKEIYQQAHKLLKTHEKNKAARYGLKKAILDLGPSGYPFERFVAEIMQHEGFTTKVGTTMQGKCVTHEVDVFAENEGRVYMMECKFHNKLGYKTDVKVPMYIKSRFEDLQYMWQKEENLKDKYMQGWVVTNARFTSDAIDFGNCSGLRMMSWDYPEGRSLKDLINKHSLFPITSLSGLSKAHKETLLAAGVVLAKTLCETPEKLHEYGIEKSKLEKIILEAQLVCDI